MVEIAVSLLELPNKEYIFQRRTSDAPTSPGLLGLFGGHRESSDGTVLEAVQRELGEETSLNLTKDDFLYITAERETSPSGEGGRQYHLFLAKVSDVDFEIFEGAGKEVYSLDEAITRSDIASGARLLIEKVIREELV